MGKNHKIRRALARALVFVVLFCWTFSGYPKLLEFDYGGKHYELPKIEKSRADMEVRRPTAGYAYNTVNSSYTYDASGTATYSYTPLSNYTTYFHTWQTTSYSYTNTYIKIVYSASGIVNDTYALAYSTDSTTNANGQCVGTFTTLVGPTANNVSQTTIATGDLGASPDMSKFCVRLDTVKSGGADKNAWVYLYDIWSEGTYTVAYPPVASAVSIDSGASGVTLTENATKNVVCSATVTDANGYADITSVEAKLYRTGVGSAASDDPNNHYTLAGDSQCVPSGGSGNTETYTCTFAVQFFAEPTDAGSIYASDNWTCLVTPSDSGGAGTAASDTIEVNTLLALNVTSSINYGNLSLGSTSGSYPKIVTVTNTGNANMDPQVSSAAAMTCTTGTIPVANQEYADFSFTYGSGYTLSGTPTTLNLALPKPTSDTPVTANSYWGISIPSTGISGSCSGSNTFTAVAGS